MADETEDLKRRLRTPRAKAPPPRAGLSTGCTLVNLALTGKPSWGFLPGSYYLLVGDSRAGKTFLGLTSLAEACYNKAFDGYRLVADMPEHGALMDHQEFFGPRFVKRVEVPKPSRTLEEFYYRADGHFAKGPCVYFLDSMDALQPEQDDKLFRAKRDKFLNGKKKPGQEEDKGSYGTAKARANSSNLRVLCNRLADHQSILVVVAQSRDNIGMNAMFNPKTRGGGRALTFYATGELWFSIKGKLKVKVGDRDLQKGTVLRVAVKKSRSGGREPSVDLHHYPRFAGEGNGGGFDDVGSLIAYLIEWGHWKGTEKAVEAPEFNFSGSREQLVTIIEEGGKEKSLRLLAAEVWDAIDQRCRVERKKRYG